MDRCRNDANLPGREGEMKEQESKAMREALVSLVEWADKNQTVTLKGGLLKAVEMARKILAESKDETKTS